MYGGMQGRKAAMLFEYKILTWIAKFKFTNYQVISRLFSISPSTARDKLKRLEKKGLIRKVPCMSVCNGQLILATVLSSVFKF